MSVSIAVKVAEFSSLKSSYAGVHNYCNILVVNDLQATRFGLHSHCLIGRIHSRDTFGIERWVNRPKFV